MQVFIDNAAKKCFNCRMEDMAIKITASKNLVDQPLDKQTLESAIFVEDASHSLCISHISVTGKYNREYTVAAYIVELNEHRVLIDNDLLIICLWSNILVIDLKSDKLIKNVDLDSWEQFEIYKFKSGYIIHGEDAIRFMNADFEVLWDIWAVDIYVNGLVEKDFEVFDDYVIAYDWNGYKHYFDENGQFKAERHPEYDYEKR